LLRPLLPALAAALAPGGLLFYETFTRDNAAEGAPIDGSRRDRRFDRPGGPTLRRLVQVRGPYEHCPPKRAIGVS